VTVDIQLHNIPSLLEAARVGALQDRHHMLPPLQELRAEARMLL
jgi:hypothetical protein